jgi:molybdate transport system substrate-binding protein
MWSLMLTAALTVSAAASLSDVVTELARRYEAASGRPVHVNTAASNTLARQIAEGAPVDVFVSADETQMNVVIKSGMVVDGTRVALLTNQLVIVTPQNARTVAGPRDLASSTVKRVAMGQPDSVPAGVYGRQWLEKLGLWSAVQPKVVPMPTVRAALAAVREGRADAAIVYATDARTTKDVRVAHVVSIADGPAIVYPAAVIRGKNENEARRFLEYLQSADARAVFEAAGFGIAAGR